MPLRTSTFCAVALGAFSTLLLSLPALADGIHISDAYARANGPSAKAGAAFLEITNEGAEDDRLVGAASDVAKMVQLHRHNIDENGVAKMMHVMDGFLIPSGSMHVLARGGDHVMFMGLTESFEQGKIISVILTFEKAGDITVEIPVDLER